jgi:hypothetical protein
MYEHLNFGLAKHASLMQQKQIDLEIDASLADIKEDVELLRDNVKEFERALRSILYGTPRTTCG